MESSLMEGEKSAFGRLQRFSLESGASLSR
jgi:hypothetical protein